MHHNITLRFCGPIELWFDNTSRPGENELVK
jgi:hypothetical protein